MSKLAKPIVFVVCLGPLAWLAFHAFTGGLGANPIEATNRSLGDWALRFLLITLAISPLKGITGWAGWMRYRRMMGLYDQFFDWAAIWDDVVKRTFITVGMVAFVGLIPLAATSTKGMVKRLGARRWQALHRIVYGIAVLAVLHFAMMVKADLLEPLIYAGILAFLLGWRVARRFDWSFPAKFSPVGRG